MKKEIKNTTILEKTVRPDKAKILKQVQDDRHAFTLAEVLITLGIIGVVAAMTMPSLVQHYKKKVASTRLKKFYSVMSQALVRSEYDNGPIDTWNYNPGENDESEAIRIEDYANTYIVPYFNGLKRKSGNYVQLENDHAIYYHLNDGSAFTIHEGGCADIRFDYNDEAGPNQLGRDRFAFLLCHSDDTRYFVLSDTPGISPYCPRSICGTRQSALATCKNDGRYCSGVLQYDGWEFKDDYPYKL